MSTSSDRLGRLGERLAARHLRAGGYEILERGWRHAGPDLRGELDLVCRDGTTIVVCEVKARRRAWPEEAAEGVDARKRRQLRRLGLRWLDERGCRGAPLRIDVVAVAWPPGGGAAAICHLEGVA